ncbi:endo-1,4-beta-xylanase [Segatella copri]|uniref:Beta-xylanase n=1 Tax=Segatella copri TaxID=165179 RepID=A0AAW5HZY9_9BACT|nr:endo-1,4-beta-xylanase [Segatella copri]MCF0067387.1 endo-1,4-beta-xylanase [Segatella copri]MCP9501493.1 endo-1,4-beta-xylanase [Segatella copri]MCP9504272.1 endo-1,4-beta-xylanase [Segatella copri]MCP9507587.1 endo-1,4-beta-xylanase [Segatella copri]MCP9510324.1 endo-1,4-beta-xylanase [Segatella copri]
MKLKNINLGLGLMALLALSSCADDKFSEYRTDMTKNLKEYQYLNNYEPLKKYVEDMKASGKCNPNFKLGIALEAAEFNKQGLVYCLAGSNFNETVAGNAMKMASCVADDGRMNFDNVSEYVKNATDAGLSVYGHTLAWHQQQPNKYLKRLIADKELPPAENNPGLIITSGDPKAETYDYEIDYDLDEPLKAGTTYEISLNVRGTNPGTIDFWPEKKGGSATQYGAGSFTVAESAVDNEFSFTPNADVDHMRFCFGKIGGTLYFDNFVLKEKGSDHNLVVNSTFDENDISHWTKPSWIEISYKIGNVAGAAAMDIENEVHKQTYTDGPFPFFAMGCEPPVVNGAIHFVPTGTWSQFFVMTGGDNLLSEGNYVVYLDMTSSKDASGVELTMQNGWGASDQAITVSVPVSAGRHNVKLQMPNIAGGNYDIILKPQTADATLDVHSVKVCQVKKSNTKPLTPEEKKEILTPVLQKWIYGMMEATEGKVKAWDVVNESISGKDIDGDGYYDLQSATRGTVSADDAKNSFYWQDYLGDLDYVRTAVAAARKGFADAGGNPEELKLFINDYNLETAYDQNKKLKSLIHWIEEWEKDGVTKIDGIGSQMHVSCCMDPVEQKKREDAYVNMLNLMVSTGRLVRISELDMGLEVPNLDKNSKDPYIQVKTTDMTEDQHKAMRAYYEFIVKKYLEIVPKEQQWGICQWCATDSPANSGWRPGLPVGLWDLDYYRKHTYAGFAAGLGAPEYWKEAK